MLLRTGRNLFEVWRRYGYMLCIWELKKWHGVNVLGQCSLSPRVGFVVFRHAFQHTSYGSLVCKFQLRMFPLGVIRDNPLPPSIQDLCSNRFASSRQADLITYPVSKRHRTSPYLLLSNASSQIPGYKYSA